jgi:hypothetical protein
MMSITDIYDNSQNLLRKLIAITVILYYNLPIILHVQCLIPSGYALEFASGSRKMVTMKAPITEGHGNVIVS